MFVISKTVVEIPEAYDWSEVKVVRSGLIEDIDSHAREDKLSPVVMDATKEVYRTRKS